MFYSSDTDALALGRLIWIAIAMLATGFALWRADVRARKRMKKALGREVSKDELNSLAAWMKVAEAEQKGQGDEAPERDDYSEGLTQVDVRRERPPRRGLRLVEKFVKATLRGQFWFLGICSFAIGFSVLCIGRRPAPAGGPAEDSNILIVLGLAAALVVASLLIRRLSRSFQGFITAVLLCCSATLLGPAMWLATASSKPLYTLPIGLVGMLLLYPGPGSPEQEAADRKSLFTNRVTVASPSLTTLTTLSLNSPPAVADKGRRGKARNR